MVHKTRGIVLRIVKFGETSLVVTVFTELFGIQSYLVNGIRQVSKKGSVKGVYFQPGAMLDLVVYKNDFKNLQRIKEYKWSYVYNHIFADVFKNSVALFSIELLSKCLKEPEPHGELFSFMEDALLHLDEASKTVTANFPLFIALHLAVFFGFRIHDSFSPVKHYLDLQEGIFTEEQPQHSYYLIDREAEAVSHILKIMQPEDLEEVKLNQDMRRRILNALEIYYALHVPEFGTLKTLPVLREISG
ncbi:MAG TPA: DNA repair protein RecO [Flavisolibacter sp.]|jgi:DNA repair protein RecO (recombination protein O)|nr:DNA repair protein RecO [Flavisolibacter sp.]